MRKKTSQNKTAEPVYLYFSIIAFLIFQYAFIVSVTNEANQKPLLAILAGMFSAVSLVMYFFKLNKMYFFSLLSLCAGAYVSGADAQNLFAFIFFILFAVFLYAGYRFSALDGGPGGSAPRKGAGPEISAVNSAPGKGLYISFFIAALVLAVSPLLIYRFFLGMDSAVDWYFPFRLLGKGGNDIFAGPFNNYPALILPCIFIAVVSAAVFFIMRSPKKLDLLYILVPIVVAFAGKYVIATLSAQGIEVFRAKIGSHDNCSYYFYAQRYMDSFWEMVTKFTSVLQIADSAHVRGHPVLPLIWYWLASKIVNSDPVRVGLLNGFVTSLSCIAFYMISTILAGNKKTGFVTAIFYALTPSSLILSVAGIDSFVVLSLAFSFAFFMTGLKQNGKIVLFISGVFFGIGTYLTFGLWTMLLPMTVYYFSRQEEIRTANIQQSVSKALKTAGHVAAGIGFVHLFFILFSQGTYNYIDSFIIGKKTIWQVSNRPYVLWVWANFLHWSQYASAAVMAMLFYRYWNALKGRVKMDAFTLSGVVALAMTFMSCIGRAEQHRMWMYLTVFVIPSAAIALMEFSRKKTGISPTKAALFSILIFIQTVLIEVFITDYV